MSAKILKDVMRDLETMKKVPQEWTDEVTADYFATENIDVARVVDDTGKTVGVVSIRDLPTAKLETPWGRCTYSKCPSGEEKQPIDPDNEVCRSDDTGTYHTCYKCDKWCTLQEVD